ncbi:MAG: 4-hydroxy-3-methylbut-2-enyl diphosphate reductase [Caulobacteraceae bacterium]
MRVMLAQPRGFCAGVVRAIDIVEKSLEKFGAPVYVRHEIVHNKHVVDSLKAKGAVFVEEINEIPDGAVTIFSAHGVARSVVNEAAGRNLPVLDATCPLVSKVHAQGKRYVSRGPHPDPDRPTRATPKWRATLGQVDGPVILVSTEEDVQKLELRNDAPVSYVTQTTLSVDETKGVIAAPAAPVQRPDRPQHLRHLLRTQHRQTAVRDLCKVSDIILVVGAANSSNSNRLCEIGKEEGPAQLPDRRRLGHRPAVAGRQGSGRP